MINEFSRVSDYSEPARLARLYFKSQYLMIDDSKTIVVPEKKYWDNQNGVYVTSPRTELRLEHSLTAIMIWESIHKKAFLKEDEKTTDEMLSYIKCMTINDDVPPIVYSSLSSKNISEINAYISENRTSSVINSNESGETSKDTPTAELIQYWMISLHVPQEAKNWHLSRLLSLIKVLNVKNKPPGKSSRNDTIKNHAARKAAARRRRAH